MGIFPILGGGSDPNPLVYVCLPSFFLACQNHPEMLKHSLLFFLIFSLWDIFRKKRYLVEKIPILGEGGLPTWEFFPLSTVFFLKTFLRPSEFFGSSFVLDRTQMFRLRFVNYGSCWSVGYKSLWKEGICSLMEIYEWFSFKTWAVEIITNWVGAIMKTIVVLL